MSEPQQTPGGDCLAALVLLKTSLFAASCGHLVTAYCLGGHPFQLCFGLLFGVFVLIESVRLWAVVTGRTTL